MTLVKWASDDQMYHLGTFAINIEDITTFGGELLWAAGFNLGKSSAIVNDGIIVGYQYWDDTANSCKYTKARIALGEGIAYMELRGAECYTNGDPKRGVMRVAWSDTSGDTTNAEFYFWNFGENGLPTYPLDDAAAYARHLLPEEVTPTTVTVYSGCPVLLRYRSGILDGWHDVERGSYSRESNQSGGVTRWRITGSIPLEDFQLMAYADVGDDILGQLLAASQIYDVHAGGVTTFDFDPVLMPQTMQVRVKYPGTVTIAQHSCAAEAYLDAWEDAPVSDEGDYHYALVHTYQAKFGMMQQLQLRIEHGSNVLYNETVTYNADYADGSNQYLSIDLTPEQPPTAAVMTVVVETSVPITFMTRPDGYLELGDWHILTETAKEAVGDGWTYTYQFGKEQGWFGEHDTFVCSIRDNTDKYEDADRTMEWSATTVILSYPGTAQEKNKDKDKDMTSVMTVIIDTTVPIVFKTRPDGLLEFAQWRQVAELSKEATDKGWTYTYQLAKEQGWFGEHDTFVYSISDSTGQYDNTDQKVTWSPTTLRLTYPNGAKKMGIDDVFGAITQFATWIGEHGAQLAFAVGLILAIVLGLKVFGTVNTLIGSFN
jgi:hypothetical protein